ncbi:hypothetical protein K7432_004052 [Basidiobolus ranarum]|uniref:RNI-like protein n=1 Tax=Basidiobolus ranarum TaxID=34480 RepID=A0ABR2WZ00_9FUNG
MISETNASKSTLSQPSIFQVKQNSYEEVLHSLNPKNTEISSNVPFKHNSYEGPTRNQISHISQVSLSDKDMTKIQEVIQQNQETHDQNEKIHEQDEKMHQHLALLDRKMAALLTRNYELHEFPIPRMFIILPVDQHPANLATTEYRLYFLCECGEFTESKVFNPNSKHSIHIALHEGYDITKPKEFYAKYSSYMLYLLRALRFGLQITGLSIPAFSPNNESDRTLEKLITVTERILDISISFLDTKLSNITASRNGDTAQDEISNEGHLRELEALEGADLRHLSRFIKRNDKKKVLGNLYRITTEEGHVKWVCLDHYRINYKEAAKSHLRNIMDVQGGDYDEHLGKVMITLTSGILVKEFADAIAQTKQLLELDVALPYRWQSNDLKILDNAIRMTTIRSLALDVSNRDLGGMLNQRASTLRNVMSNAQLTIIQLKVDDWFVENGLSSIRNLSHVRILNFGNYLIPNYPIPSYQYDKDKERKWIRSVSAMLKVCPSLEQLSFGKISIGYNNRISPVRLFDKYCQLVSHYNTIGMSVCRKDILMVAGLSAIEEITNLRLYGEDPLIDVLERGSRYGSIRLKKLELICNPGMITPEAEKIAKFIGRLQLSYLELNISDCSVVPILQQIDYSLLTTFKIRGKINEKAWGILVGCLKGNCTVKELNILNTDTIVIDRRLPLRIISQLSLNKDSIGMKKLELRCSSNSSAKEVENLAMIVGHLELTHLNLAVIDCNPIPILLKIDYSLLTAFKFAGKFNETVWKELNRGLKEGFMMKELSLWNTDAVGTDKYILPCILSRLSLKSLRLYGSRGTTDKEWAVIVSNMDVSQLEYLDISFSLLGDKAVDSLIKRLSEAPVLSHLVFYRTQISEVSSNNLKVAIESIPRTIVYQDSPHFMVHPNIKKYSYNWDGNDELRHQCPLCVK